MYRYNQQNAKPRAAAGTSVARAAPRLFVAMRERIRYKHYSLRTEKAYLFWVRRFVMFHGLKHPRAMGAPEVERYLTHLATVAKVAPSTHKQALAAILFLYREVLSINLPWMGEIGRPRTSQHVPVVLSREEVAAVLACLPAEHWLLCSLLYGAGLRLQEGLSLRVKDVDFTRRVIYVRNGKGAKDRVVMLPAPAEAALRAQVDVSRRLWAQDRAAGVVGVEVPFALERKLNRAAESFSWHWLFPAPTLSRDPRAQVVRRHHLYPQTVARALRWAVHRARITKRVTAHTLRHSFAVIVGGGLEEPHGTASAAATLALRQRVLPDGRTTPAMSHAAPTNPSSQPAQAGMRSTPRARTPASSTSAGAMCLAPPVWVRCCVFRRCASLANAACEAFGCAAATICCRTASGAASRACSSSGIFFHIRLATFSG